MCDKQDFSFQEVMQTVGNADHSAGELGECCVHTVILWAYSLIIAVAASVYDAIQRQK